MNIIQYATAVFLLCGIQSAVAGGYTAQIGNEEANCSQQLDVIAVVDASESIDDFEFVTLQNALVMFIESIGLGDEQRFGVVLYSSTVGQGVPLSSDRDSLITQIENLNHLKDGTSTHLGIQEMRTIMEANHRPGVPQVGIVITDGMSKDQNLTRDEASRAKAFGINMFAVGVGPDEDIDEQELRDIASSDDQVLKMDDFDQLLNNITSLVGKVCIVDGGWTDWEVLAGACSVTCGCGKKLVTRTRSCTNPPPSMDGEDCPGLSVENLYVNCTKPACPKANCSQQLDVIAVVDASESIDDFEFVTLQNALVMFIEGIGLGDEQRFGVVLYSSTVGQGVPLSSDRDSLITQIENLNHLKDGTSTHLGIQEMRTIMEANHRPGVPQVGIVITDGMSKDQNLTRDEASRAKAFGINMFAVGVGPDEDIDEQELRDIASSDDQVLKMDDFDQLLNNITSLVGKVCIVDGGWTDWEVLAGACSVTCGCGKKLVTRTRSCTNPPPSMDGEDCPGLSVENLYVNCTKPACPNASGICDGCRYINGVGYLPVKGVCSQFIHCIDSGLRHTIRTCPTGLFWSQKLLTCVWPHQSNCIPGATPITYDPITTTTTRPVTCGDNIRAVAGNVMVYEQYVPGHGWMVRPCAPGTVFSSTTCTCELGNTRSVVQVCRPELYLPLDTDVEDHSGNYLSVQNDGVVISGSHAVIDEGAGLRVLRFSNADFGTTLTISFLFNLNSDSDQAIVSNADCDKAGSFYILQLGSCIVFRVYNTAGVRHQLVLPFDTPTSQYVSAVFSVADGVMTARVGAQSGETEFLGRIRTSQCALQIGRASGFQHFSGILKSFQLYMCSS